MDKILGVINLVNEASFLKELTAHRCLASVPFGGRYRLIDFTLTNFINAGITKVAIFPRERFRALMDHLGSGKEWDLDRQTEDGLYILPPAHPNEPIKGDLQQFYDHIEMFKRSTANTVVISPGVHVNKIDFNDVIKAHRANDADVTVVYKTYDGSRVYKPLFHKCEITETGDLLDVEFFTLPKKGDPVLLETYVIDKDLLISLMETCIDNEEYSFLKDIVKAHLGDYKIKGYEFKGEMLFFHSIKSFYQCQLDLLNPDKGHSFFSEGGEVLTKIKHEAPARFGSTSSVSNSLIANGCEIDGQVENCVLFRGVKVHKGAIVKNSIIMQKGEIEEGAYIENVIADKQVTITKNRHVESQGEPRVIKKLEVM